MDPLEPESWQPRLPDVVVYRGPTGWPAIVDAHLAAYRDNTLQAYRRDIAHWTVWCERAQLEPLQATRADVQRYSAEQLDDLKPATVKRRLSSIAGVYGWCVAEGLLDKSPLDHVRRPKVSEESNTRGVDEDEIVALLRAGTTTGLLERALVAMLALNGMRISAVCNANVEDLGVENGVRFLAITLKGGRLDRRSLNPITAAALDAYLTGRRRGPLLQVDGKRLDRYKGRRIVIRLGEFAGIPPGITAHSLRHGFATVSLAAGAKLEDVQDAMGHADPRTTQRYNRARRRLERDPTHLLGKLFADDPAQNTSSVRPEDEET